MKSDKAVSFRYFHFHNEMKKFNFLYLRTWKRKALLVRIEKDAFNSSQMNLKSERKRL